jgi:hypothetical protein
MIGCIIIGPLGLAVGYLVAVRFSMIFGSPKRAFIAANFIGILMNLVKIVENTSCVLTGRFGFGVCCGIQSFLMGKALNETVPSSDQQGYMTLINISACFGMLVATLLNMTLPIKDSSNF